MARAQALEQSAGNLHDVDFLAWTERQAEALRARQIAALDWHHLLEEIEDMGASQRRELKSRLRVLLMHLIQWKWQAEKRSPSWMATLVEQRYALEDLLEVSPGLRGTPLDEAFADAWPKAVNPASLESALPLSTFPQHCPWTREDVLSPDWMPE